MRRLVPAAAVIALLAGCAAPPPAPAPISPKEFAEPLAPGELALERVPDREWPDLAAVPIGDRPSLIAAIDRSLDYLSKPSSRRYYPYLDITHERARASLEALRALFASDLPPVALAAAIRARFDCYRSKGRARTGEVLFTAYCEPIYRASLAPTAEFRYPLYRRPPELTSDAEGRPLGWTTHDGVLYRSPTRREIDEGGFLANRGLELCWLRDPLEAYLVHVQGSARLVLDDGRVLPVGYAGKTEHPYASLGKAIGASSLREIKEYFARHGAAAVPTLWRNDSYVFFRETEGGPFGSLGVPVTAGRTIATDKSVFPRAALALVDARGVRGFALDQDTGGAIRSAGRCDIFLGTGPEAERRAGDTMVAGRLYYFFLKSGPYAANAAQ